MRVCLCKVGGLGDTLSVAPLVATLAAAGVSVTVLGGPAAVLLPARRVVVVERRRIGGLGGLRHLPVLARRLGRHDVALLSFDETTAVQAVAALVAPRRIGFAAGIARGEALLTERLPFAPQRPVADHALDLGRRLLGRDLVLTRPPLPAAQRRDGGYGVIHPGAATALQRWPGMSALGERLAARTAFPWRTVEAAEAFDAPALARLIGGARAFVGGHSGPLHLAALLGVPHVAVAGPSAVAWDPPWPEVPGRILRAGLACQPCGAVGAPARACVQDAPARGRPGDAPPPCLTAWTPEAVAAAVEEVLDGR